MFERFLKRIEYLQIANKPFSLYDFVAIKKNCNNSNKILKLQLAI